MEHRSDTHGGRLPRAVIRLAIIEPRSDTLQHIHCLVSQNAILSVRVLADMTSYVEAYGAGSGPDVLLAGLDSNPRDALATVKRIVTMSPTSGVIVYGRPAALDLLPQAMAAGARRYLPYPFDSGLLFEAIEDVHKAMKLLVQRSSRAAPESTPPPAGTDPYLSKVITVFSPKGGVGTTTLAVNLACALQTLGRRVAIMDGNISFGNVGLFLNMSPSLGMLELVQAPSNIDAAGVDEMLLTHPSGLKVLLSPPHAEEGDTVQSDHLRQIIAVLRSSFDYVIVDTWPSYDERVLAMLEMADKILLPTGPELPSVKNIAAFLRVAQLLQYSEEKLIPILIRADSVSAEHLRGLEGFLGRSLEWRIVSDGKRVTESVNYGEPFVLTEPNAPVSRTIYRLARVLDGQKADVPDSSPRVEALLQQTRPALAALSRNVLTVTGAVSKRLPS